MNSEISELRQQLAKAIDERNTIAYRLAKEILRSEELEIKLENFEAKTREGTNLLKEIVAQLAPVSGFNTSAHPMNIVSEVVRRLRKAKEHG